MPKLVLLGDSIFDNYLYVHGVGPSITQWLEMKLENSDFKVTNCAIDGDIIDGVYNQHNTSIPKDGTHIALSVGGNDGLHYLGNLMNGRWFPLNIISGVLKFPMFFKEKYSKLLDFLVSDGRPLILCTIYFPLFEHFITKWVARVGVSIASWIIIAEAKKRGLPVIDLRKVFSKDIDYANPIEPGVPGGDKIGTNIVHILETHDFTLKKYKLYHIDSYSDERLQNWKINESRYLGDKDNKHIMHQREGLRSTRENDQFRKQKSL
mmetsp:Transcript_4066/g.5219  ORF Transcript_4066/g.5219 Transcript_4066/m.5219 type:complete len:264 (+) Transcript_4066:60-851(+)